MPCRNSHFFWLNCIPLTLCLLLLSGGACSPRDRPPASPIEAVLEGDVAWLQDAIRKDPLVVHFVDTNGRGLLHPAATGSSEEVVEILAKAGASIDMKDASGNTPLYIAASAGNVKIAKALIKHGADCRNPSILDVAAMSGRLELVQALLDHGATPVPSAPHRPMTALHWACRMVVSRDTEVDPRNPGNRAVIALLAQAIDVNSQGESLRTPLHFAAQLGNVEAVRYLLSNYEEIKVDAEDSEWNTPLHLAVFSKGVTEVEPSYQAEVVRLLLKAGADRSRKNADGKTSINLAEEHGKAHLSAILIQE